MSGEPYIFSPITVNLEHTNWKAFLVSTLNNSPSFVTFLENPTTPKSVEMRPCQRFLSFQQQLDCSAFVWDSVLSACLKWSIIYSILHLRKQEKLSANIEHWKNTVNSLFIMLMLNIKPLKLYFNQVVKMKWKITFQKMGVLKIKCLFLSYSHSFLSRKCKGRH